MPKSKMIANTMNKLKRAVPMPMPIPTPKAKIDNSPANAMGQFLQSMMGRMKTNLRNEFDLNDKRCKLLPEEEMNLKRSKAFLPTFARAFNKQLPDMVNDFVAMIANLIGSILGLFNISQNKTDKIVDKVKSVGQKLFSDAKRGKPAETVQHIAQEAAPALIKLFTKLLGVKISDDTMRAAASFPTPTAKKQNRRNSVSSPKPSPMHSHAVKKNKRRMSS